MTREQELLTEIRDLLQIIAEPQLAKRDAKLRSELRAAVGRSAKKAKAVMLMNGSRTQKAIAKESGMDAGNLSRLVKDLAAEGLLLSDQGHPRLTLAVPTSFFDEVESDE